MFKARMSLLMVVAMFSSLTSLTSLMAWELKQPAKKQVEELMNRWNVVAEKEQGDFKLTWTDYDKFPHPTFQGGSDEAYARFTQILVSFLTPDNIDFIRKNNLVELPIHSSNPSQQLGSFGTLVSLVRVFAMGAGRPDEVRLKLGKPSDELDRVY